MFEHPQGSARAGNLTWLQMGLRVAFSTGLRACPQPTALLHPGRTDLAPHIPHFLGAVVGGVSPHPTGVDACQLPGIVANKLIS